MSQESPKARAEQALERMIREGQEALAELRAGKEQNRPMPPYPPFPPPNSDEGRYVVLGELKYIREIAESHADANRDPDEQFREIAQLANTAINIFERGDA
jgi:hypothetical protein